jgi:Adenylate cyclase, family 3 (some proteins contain HAMP domain)
MEPRIQYAKTTDGVGIAFASMGEGPPLIRLMSAGFAHVLRDWATFPGFYQPASRAFRLIWYDPRGSGLSDRDEVDFSMEAMMRDLEAVIDHTGLRSFAVFAIANSVPVAVTYAAKYPDRVSHLILYNGWTRSSDFVGSPGQVAAEALIDKDWTLYTETVARVLGPTDDPQVIERLGEHMRACIEPEAYRAFVAAARSYDVSALLPDVKAKTLVLHRASSRVIPVRAGQKLAAGIPDARFLVDDDMTLERGAALIEEFAGTAEKPEPVLPGAFRTILFTDVEGSTALTQRLGDARAREVMREHERITRECLRAHGGSEVKTMGDGFMASFGSAVKALECAVAVQKAFAEHSAGGEAIRVRIGLNAGEPIAEEADLFGTAVIAAARIAARAGGGEILASDVVRQLVAGKGFLFSDRGEVVLRGFDDPVRLFEVRWQEDA